MKAKQMYSWIKRATSKDRTRETLARIKIEHDKVYSTDGFRLHVGKIDLDNGATEYRDTLYTLAGLDDKVHDKYEHGNYPDIGYIVQDYDRQCSEDTCHMVVDAKHLRDALTGLSGEVRITIDGPNRPMRLQTEENYILIMPMSIKRARLNEETAYKPAVFINDKA
jgi:DNA polymerase III sliding clamp (beta) subunit (PCNA family)